ncbi:bifunctional diaminohydroxyphosphoribosylaminopyrimidine deaminase/5-amino-6-(5-phosphoribosylamino)uracil reductase RibD [Helicobacter jaachi]|uniref:Bifunctional diaminohydroxyphosphoribosylaminopyrimidine deaminase/5-amino-6-(5-phosphoribosylamino)uracil reductase RibD n=1 Tax=Helicobacter jaachi TaxID=1677920 RepID=A0A4U8TBX7_9HELI|nr:bifunctional diaminohydroxyphosphoribosylaminopyrimidine deaminase/5-amino-6-(5-phosphoribosylamino)uracil reductase RibD [Helicobacter jaachi]TLD97450.1 bifunctional diaminohydroxyphosphoribosylaminopyrimidine deaminase/5-amino-6-(5-phosphoribosylamino)uracil reductase RibD [Helicobacter jaachi]
MNCDEILLNHCCNLAWQTQSLALPNPSVGAMVVDKNGNILGQGVHKIAGSPHAEVLALQEAYYTLSRDERILALKKSDDIHAFLLQNHNQMFKECALYVSLEPCNHKGKTPPCAHLLAQLGFAKVCIAALDNHALAAGGREYLISHGINAIFVQSPALQEAAHNLLLPFETLRQKGRFVLFKLAHRLDGSYTQGRISSQISQIFTHNQRSVCDWLCISGKTLNTDNPKLNARYALPPYDKTHLPQIGIISRHVDSISEHLASRARIIKDIEAFRALGGFIIVEGGFNLLSMLKDEIDMLLIHAAFWCDGAHNNAHFIPHNLKAHFKLIHTMPLGEDLAIWLR